MKKYVIYLLLMMFSSMGAQAQKSYFKEALEKLVSNKAFTMNQSGAKMRLVTQHNGVGKNIALKLSRKTSFSRNWTKSTRLFKRLQSACN